MANKPTRVFFHVSGSDDRRKLIYLPDLYTGIDFLAHNIYTYL